MSTDKNDNKAAGSVVQTSELTDDILKIIEGHHHNPFSVLGRHKDINGEVIRVLLPHAEAVQLGDAGQVLVRVQDSDLFEYRLQDDDDITEYYTLEWVDDSGNQHTTYDPYSFVPQLSEFDIHLFGEGKHWHIYRILGAHPCTIDEIKGTRFAVWAPNAQRISVVGDFNRWDGRQHPMHLCGGGVWELFIPEMEAGTFYKFEIRSQQGDLLLKTDPYGQQFQLRPETASVVLDKSSYRWKDKAWLKQREKTEWLETPISVYEVHLGSWRLDEAGEFLSYRALAKQLVDYVKELGFTHIELMPITEHPLDISWGYQTTGYFAPTRRHGEADDFRYFVDYFHQNGIGVLLDWVPAHFPKDAHGLANFDGTALYEHSDPRQGEHRDWGTLIYNFGRNEVKNFLLASAMFWLEEYHIDGLRVDAVASMLYLDYSREEGDWIANQYGGNENLEAIDFLRDLNVVVHEQHPGAMVVAEESTSWPQVTRPTWTGGLGFSIKWNMGWMHDTLVYMSKEPIHRTYHHDQITFGLLYAFTENFMLPFSHDEVVHGKQSMINKMPGDEWQRFANLRLLYTYMFVYPGKKLLFMGCEFAQGSEWNCEQALDWYVLDYPQHQGIKTLVGDLNRLYRNTEALHKHDFGEEGFEWIDCHDSGQSVLSFIRKTGDEIVIGVFNFTPVVRKDYRIGVPLAGDYKELMNSDSSFYGGSNTGNAGQLTTDDIEATGRPYSINLVLPPLAGIVLSYQSRQVLEVENDDDQSIKAVDDDKAR